MLESNDVERTLRRIAHEIVEKNPDMAEVAVVGIHTRGAVLANRIHGLLTELTGTVKGQAIEFSFDANVQGTSLTVRYRGTVEGKDAMKGSVDLGGQASGTFTGTRK